MSEVIHVNKAFFPEVGGIETVCKQYALLSKSLFKKVSVLTIDDKVGFGWRNEIVDGITVKKCRYQFLFFGHRFSIEFFCVLFYLSFKEIVLHMHDPFPLATLALVFSKPHKLIVTYHSDIIKQKSLKPLVDIIRMAVLNKATVITTTSSEMIKNSDLLCRLKQKKIHILPLFLDDLAIYKKPISEANIVDVDILSATSNKQFLLMLGRMNYYKGLDVLLSAIQKLESEGRLLSTEILIIGKIVDIEAKNTLDTLSSLSKKITVIDKYISIEEKLYLLQKCSGLLFLSNHRSEAFGIVQLEAMAAGTPVINMNIKSGVPWVSKHNETGLTCLLYTSPSPRD